jgi:hypothetical protein
MLRISEVSINKRKELAHLIIQPFGEGFCDSIITAGDGSPLQGVLV